MYKAVIFDLDGTLLDTISDIADSVNITLKRLKYKQYTIEEYKHFVGKGIDVLIKRIIKAGNINTNEFENIKQGYIEEYALRNSKKTKPYPGIINLLKSLQQNNIKIAILSNKPHFQTEAVVDQYFKDVHFDLVFGKKPEYPIKPDPTSANEMVKLLKLNKNQILYVGDTNTDIETAKNTGITSVGVLWGFRDIVELKTAGADFIVDDPEKILKIVLGE